MSNTSDSDPSAPDSPDPSQNSEAATGANESETIDHTLEEAAEAIIFAADEPVSSDRIAEIITEVTGRTDLDAGDIEQVVDQLRGEYREADRALEIQEWAGGYRMTTRAPLSPFVKTLFVGEQEKSLSRSLMETLAVIAYRQPVTRPEVDFIRGVNSDYAIRKLLEMGLADVEGRADSLGRPLLYGTTPLFLEQFGLKSLEELPTLREVEELLDDPAFDEERAKLLQLDAEEELSVDLLEEMEEEESSSSAEEEEASDD